MAIRQGDWKLVKAPGIVANAENWGNGIVTTDGAELYNLAEDIGEKNNLAAKYPEKVKELAANWNKWNAELVEPKWRPNRQPRRNQVVAAEVITTNLSAGPLKNGDVVTPQAAPRISRHALAISAEVESAGTNGVIIAQGAGVNGYALYLKDGKLAFALRNQRELTTVTAEKPLGTGRLKVGASLAANGDVLLTVNGNEVAKGHASLIQTQPARGLTIGSSNQSIGDYTAPNAFTGKIENVFVKSL